MPAIPVGPVSVEGRKWHPPDGPRRPPRRPDSNPVRSRHRFGRRAALLAGRWWSEARATGRTLGLADALIAAAAYIDGAGLLTRNTRDFALTPVRLVTC